MRQRSGSSPTKTRRRKPAARTPTSRQQHPPENDPNKTAEQLRRERDEAREQQTATSEVLKVISSSRGELAPVFAAILANAAQLCEANFGTLQLHENGAFRVAAMHNPPPAFAEYRQRQKAIIPSPHNALGRVVATKRLVHIADYAEEAAYNTTSIAD